MRYKSLIQPDVLVWIWGVAGAPETFLVDSKGVIYLRIQGEVNDRVYAKKIQPVLETIQ